jgi:hypothetical protein
MGVFRPTYKDPKTGERRQSRIWWYEFCIAGRRIRESARTTRKTVAIEAENRRRLELERALAGLPTNEPERRIRPVDVLLDEYAKGYRLNHRPKSVALVEGRAAHLKRILGNLLPVDLTEARLLDYIARRQAEGGQWPHDQSRASSAEPGAGVHMEGLVAAFAQAGGAARRGPGLGCRGRGPSAAGGGAEHVPSDLSVPDGADLDRDARR